MLARVGRSRGRAAAAALALGALAQPSPALGQASNAASEAAPSLPPVPPDNAPSDVRVSLADAVRLALKSNPTFQTAVDEVRRAQGILEQVRAASIPTVFGTASYLQLDRARASAALPLPVNGGAGFVTVPPDTLVPEHQFGANLTIAVPLLAPRAWLNWREGADSVGVAQASAADVRRTVAVAVARAYLAVVEQKRVIEAATRARDTDNAHYVYAHERYVGGIGNRIDEVRADQQRQSDEAVLEQDYANLAREREALGVLAGAPGALDADEPNLQANVDPERAMRDAEHRSDVEAADMRRLAAGRAVRDDWSDYAPSLTATFEPFFWDPTSVTQPQSGWQALFVLSLPIYDGGVRYGLAKQRASIRDEAQTSLDATLRQARSDVRTAFEEVRRADAALKSSRQAADLAETALQLAEIAYRGGAATNIEVIDAERTARDAETAVAVAEDAARQARLDLLAATGRFP